ncbi:trimethylamine methyltransferase family protein [Alsobacter sp. SYSU M60028]|uniref:Methyltransferase n=1 Tax=Alsobacter ponti TaxID=2962936 RepID=A0ABT1LH54_9HYPH|nr:trimethylamine methyltransferase family protein [Alsobacter ponti]MCP8940208.1 trimethylamine methyltransferase family protein [Alsobacter ponti]
MTTNDTDAPSRRQRREGHRAPRARQAPVAARQSPWGQLRNPYRPFEILSADAIEAIHAASLHVLETTGISVQSDSVRALCVEKGAEPMADGVRVRFDRALVETAIATAPSSFTIATRNPARTVRVGDGHLVFSTVSGPPNCSDLAGGRRPGSMKDYEDFLRLGQLFNVVHVIGGYPVEPLDVPVPVRHLVGLQSMVTLTDKAPRIYCHNLQRTRDALEIIRIAAGRKPGEIEREPISFAIINTNSPLQLDKAMVEGIVEMARMNQPTVITPFTLAGAMAPVTLIGALAQQNAEALAGIAISQFARPGAPVVYGAFTTNVNMKSGAPAFGTPEYAKAALVSGQLARRYGLPFRSSNINTSNAPDAQAAYESMMATWSAITGGVNFLHQATGWLEGGLTASFEKFVMDVEMLQLFASFLRPEPVDAGSLALDAIAEVGPGGHFFATSHTLERYETAFYAPLLSDWRNFDAWAADGARDATQRAAAIAQQALSEYEQPQLDEAAAEEIAAFVARRTQEGGAPVN